MASMVTMVFAAVIMFLIGVCLGFWIGFRAGCFSAIWVMDQEHLGDWPVNRDLLDAIVRGWIREKKNRE